MALGTAQERIAPQAFRAAAVSTQGLETQVTGPGAERVARAADLDRRHGEAVSGVRVGTGVAAHRSHERVELENEASAQRESIGQPDRVGRATDGVRGDAQVTVVEHLGTVATALHHDQAAVDRVACGEVQRADQVASHGVVSAGIVGLDAQLVEDGRAGISGVVGQGQAHQQRVRTVRMRVATNGLPLHGLAILILERKLRRDEVAGTGHAHPGGTTVDPLSSVGIEAHKGSIVNLVDVVA